MEQLFDEPGQATADQDADLRRILEGTAPATGKDFFRALVCNLAQVMEVAGA